MKNTTKKQIMNKKLLMILLLAAVTVAGLLKSKASSDSIEMTAAMKLALGRSLLAREMNAEFNTLPRNLRALDENGVLYFTNEKLFSLNALTFDEKLGRLYRLEMAAPEIGGLYRTQYLQDVSIDDGALSSLSLNTRTFNTEPVAGATKGERTKHHFEIDVLGFDSINYRQIKFESIHYANDSLGVVTQLRKNGDIVISKEFRTIKENAILFSQGSPKPVILSRNALKRVFGDNFSVLRARPLEGSENTNLIIVSALVNGTDGTGRSVMSIEVKAFQLNRSKDSLSISATDQRPAVLLDTEAARSYLISRVELKTLETQKIQVPQEAWRAGERRPPVRD